MRLLKYEDNGELKIISFEDDAIPPYAILSHTWGADTEEVTFADLDTSDGKNKSGYRKIRLCGQQAHQDGLQYFWVDTCCINKSDKAEHSSAIQSMFEWYRNATRCYVYLPSVTVKGCASSSTSGEYIWESAFRSSRWFKRGWTLQELLAPRIVEFFSEEWEKIGDKASLKSFIREITGIPHKALDGAPLSQFSVAERLRWKGDRETKREEDAWYSMSGIFNVEIAPAYSEGAASAFSRLMDEIRVQEICIQDVRQTDPRDDKSRIEEMKGGLLADSYLWILDNVTFQQWQQDPHTGSRLLWVKGNPGKGKTMLLCGIIDELRTSMPSTTLLSYFFCQATDSRVNSATAVLRGLLYMLVDQQPSLVSHVRKKYDRAGKTLFEDANAWVALTEIFVDVLRDHNLTTCLIIDALDECVIELPKLLDFIVKQSSVSPRVKWIVSSRRWPEIETQLERVEDEVRLSLSLELNAEPITAAVAVFIRHKVDMLARKNQYEAEVRHAMLNYLTSNANGTFLWATLLCQELEQTPNWLVLEKLDSLSRPERMQSTLHNNDDSDTTKHIAGNGDTLVNPSVFSAQHQTSSAEDTLVNADMLPMESVSFTMYDYQKSPTGLPEDDSTDVESILSRDDVSEVETTASMTVYQHTATDIITKALLDDSELSHTYSEAIERVGQGRFLRNNRKLLQWLSKDLKTNHLLPSEHMAIRFLGRQRGSELVCAAIYHDLIGTRIGHGKQSQLDPSEDKSMMLNRFLSQMDSAEQLVFSQVPQDQNYPEASPSDDSDTSSHSDENDDEDLEEERTEKLKATVKFLVSGQPFQVYKQRLYEWLHPPLLAHASKQDNAANTGSSPEDTVFVAGLTAPTEKSDVFPAGDALIRYTEDEIHKTDDYTLSRIKDTVPSILSGDRYDPSHYESLEKSLGIVVASQQEVTLHDSIFASSLPLLVDKILRHVPCTTLEPTVSTGKVRVYWTLSGKRMFDDYVELDSGAAVELKEALQKRYTPSKQAGAGGEVTSGLFQRILNVFGQQDVGQQHPDSDVEQGRHESTRCSGRPAPIASEREEENQKQEGLHLLLCVDDGRAQTTLKHEVLQNINDDRELFNHLRKQYFIKRSWFTLRSIGAVALAQFDVNYSNTTNVYRHENVCGITTDEHLDRALGFYCLCIPPEERVGDTKEYLCNPAPKSRNRRLVPVLGPTMLKADFLNSHFITAGQRTTLNQLPKRRLQGELKATPEDLAIGWGLHIEEDWHWPTIYCCFVVIILFSFAFGIVWSVKRNDIQGAFAVSGFALTLGSMFLGYMAIPKT